MKAITILLALLALVGCGGGSGSGTGAQQGLRVLHGGIEFWPVEVLSSASEEVLGSASFLDTGARMRLAAEGQQLRVIARGRPFTILSYLDLSTYEGGNVSILVYGEPGSQNFQTTLIGEAYPEVASSSALFRVVHATLGAASIRVTDGISEIASASYGQASEFQVIEPGEKSFSFQRSVDSKVLDGVSAILEPGKVYTLLVAGEVDVFVRAKMYQDDF